MHPSSCILLLCILIVYTIIMASLVFVNGFSGPLSLNLVLTFAESLAKEGQGGYLNVAENGRIQDHQSGQDGGRDTDRADKTASSVSQIIASFQRM